MKPSAAQACGSFSRARTSARASGLGFGTPTEIVQCQRETVARGILCRIQYQHATVTRLGFGQPTAAPQKICEVQMKSRIRRIELDAVPNQPLAFRSVAAFGADETQKMVRRRVGARLFEERHARKLQPAAICAHSEEQQFVAGESRFLANRASVSLVIVSADRFTWTLEFRTTEKRCAPVSASPFIIGGGRMAAVK